MLPTSSESVTLVLWSFLFTEGLGLSHLDLEITHEAKSDLWAINISQPILIVKDFKPRRKHPYNIWCHIQSKLSLLPNYSVMPTYQLIH